jgi:Tfp pilus assembly protein FimT
MNRTTSARRAQLGFTLVELCASVGIGAALLGQAVPAMTKLQQEQKLRAEAMSLASDIRFARGEAVRLNSDVFVRVSGRGAQACYVLHTGAKNDCDCSGGRARCSTSSSQIIKAGWLPASQPVRISSNVETLQFQRGQGLVTPTGSIDLSLDNGPTVRQVIAVTGRARSCYVNQRVAGLPKCV